MNTRYAVIALVAGAPALWAQNPAPRTSTQPGAPLTQQTGAPMQTITFDDAIRIALKQNTTLQQANNTAALNSATVRQRRMFCRRRSFVRGSTPTR